MRYRIGGREKMLSVGVYPDVPLKHARDKRDSIRRMIASGIDPSAKWDAEKKSQADTFAAIAAEWLDLQRNGFSPAALEKAEWTIKDLLAPFIGSLPIRAITAPEILAVVCRLEARGNTRRRIERSIGQDRSSDLRSQPAELIVIRPQTCAERCAERRNEPHRHHRSEGSWSATAGHTRLQRSAGDRTCDEARVARVPLIELQLAQIQALGFDV